MVKTRTTFIALALAGAGVYGAWSFGGLPGEDTESTSARHLANQIWLERLPTDQRDVIGHLVFVKHPKGRIGGAGRSSQWRHLVELFQWALEGNRLSVYFPQEEVRGHLQARTWRCEGEAPEPFELCLELSSKGRKVTYYSREDWIIDPKQIDDSMQGIRDEHPELAGIFEGMTLDGDLASAELDLSSYTEIDTLPWSP